MREGVTRGVVQPRVVIEKVLPQLDAMITEDPSQNVYFGPIEQFPDAISATRPRLAHGAVPRRDQGRAGARIRTPARVRP